MSVTRREFINGAICSAGVAGLPLACLASREYDRHKYICIGFMERTGSIEQSFPLSYNEAVRHMAGEMNRMEELVREYNPCFTYWHALKVLNGEGKVESFYFVGFNGFCRHDGRLRDEFFNRFTKDVAEFRRGLKGAIA